ncbi:protein BCAP-like isoform X2 [Anopheles coustani]|uniref:protein BCAP-like isoform X2 n=1 Tax=Anopheles coustani TaxID=139045 RepID=UPI00265932FC|nr:protein BCAP-like isoform X2 [Anopheles coustani]
MSDKPMQSDESNESQTSAGCAEPVRNCILEHESVQQIRHLISLEKSTVFVELVRVASKNIQQHKYIESLEKALEKSIEEMVAIKQLLLSDEEYQSAVETLKHQRQKLAHKFEAEHQKIDSFVKQIEQAQLQEKNEVRINRVTMEKLNKHIAAMGGKASKQANEYSALLKCCTSCKPELTGNIEELEKEIETSSAAINESTSKYEMLKKEYASKNIKLSDDVAQMQYENEQMKRTISEKHETISKLKFLQEKAAEDLKQIKLKNEQNMNNFKQELVDVEQESKKLSDENQHACDAIRILKESIQNEENEIRALQEKTSSVEKNVAKLDEDIKTAKIRINSMEEQLKKLKKESSTTGITITPAPKRLQFATVRPLQTKKTYHSSAIPTLDRESDSISIVSVIPPRQSR